MKVTGYTVCKEECGNTIGHCNTGRPIVIGLSGAVDPRYWKQALNERWIFFIQGVGIITCDDTGSAIKGRARIDVAVGNKKTAQEITGYRMVYVIGKVKGF